MPNGEVKRPRPGVWEAEQAWARTNQVGSPVSVLCQGKQFSEMRREESALGQTQDLRGMGARAQALAWRCGGCGSPALLEAAPSRCCSGPGPWGPAGYEALIWTQGFEGPEKKPNLVCWPLLNRALFAQEQVAVSPNPSPGARIPV